MTEDHATALNTRRSELTARLRRIDDQLDQPSSSDVSEHAAEIEDEEVMQSVGQAGLAELKAIDAALVRLEKGTYGICVRCDGPISEARLNAVPHAALCEECIHAK
jgi:RNA polymerase-binding transcription factor DksA